MARLAGKFTRGDRGSIEEYCRTCRLAESTRRSNSVKKSAPRIGQLTASKRNGNENGGYQTEEGEFWFPWLLLDVHLPSGDGDL